MHTHPINGEREREREGERERAKSKREKKRKKEQRKIIAFLRATGEAGREKSCTTCIRIYMRKYKCEFSDIYVNRVRKKENERVNKKQTMNKLSTAT